MRISDWSSDVCSSDLICRGETLALHSVHRTAVWETQGMGGILGYARVSTGDQDVAGQTMRLEKAGAIKVFTDVMSGKSMDRPGLADLLAYARKGDTLAVVRSEEHTSELQSLMRISYAVFCLTKNNT